VGGSDVKTGPNVAGPLRSSSNDREGMGIIDQAPVILSITGAKNCGPYRRQRATWSPDVIHKSTTVGKLHATTRDGYTQTECQWSGYRDIGASTTKKMGEIK
jgi:hypothetical protein